MYKGMDEDLIIADEVERTIIVLDQLKLLLRAGKITPIQKNVLNYRISNLNEMLEAEHESK